MSIKKNIQNMELEKTNEEDQVCLSKPCNLPLSKKSHKIDHLTEIIGVFGPFHAMICTSIGLSIIIHNWQMFSNKFYTYEPNFWCARPESEIDLSGSNWLNLSSPLNSVDNEYEFDKCLQFDIDYKNIDVRPEENTSTILCSSWEYETEPFDVSLFLNYFTLTISEI